MSPATVEAIVIPNEIPAAAVQAAQDPLSAAWWVVPWSAPSRMARAVASAARMSAVPGRA